MQLKDRTTSLINPKRSSIYWDKIGFSVGGKTILSNCSGIAFSGQIIGIFGASGCGKSTLLNCISGRLGKGKLEGNVLYNGVARVKKIWKATCAFVEQDEVMYRHLTVRETLMYAAELKLSSSMDKSEKNKKVDLIIQQLGLSRCQHTKIGDPDNKGISGGERKRVAIGIEIISDPSVVLLDEPTSGLDAFTALNLVRTLRDVGKENRRITLMSLHQPRNELLDIFDSIIILAGGKIIFSGTATKALDHFSSLGYRLPELTNPADFFLDITSIDQESSELEKESLDRIEKFQLAWSSSETCSPPETLKITTFTDHRRSWITAFSTLFRRSFIDMIRNRTVIYATLLQTIIVMLIIGLVYRDVPSDAIQGVQNRLGSFVFMGLYNTFMNVIPTVLIFPQHRQVIRRERAAGSYSASAAYMAKFASLIPSCWICSLILSAPMPFFLGLQARSDLNAYVVFIVSFLLQSQAASSFGLMVGAGVINGTTGLLIAFPILIVMLLFGGLLVNLSSLHPVVSWIQFISLIANCTKALTLVELPGLKYTFNLSGLDLNPDENFLNLVGRFGLGTVPIYGLMLMNASLAVGFTALGYILFRFTAAPNFNLGADEDKDKSKGDNSYGIRNLSSPETVIPLKDISGDPNKLYALPIYDEMLSPLNLNDEDTDIRSTDGRDSLYAIYMDKEAEMLKQEDQSKKSLRSTNFLSKSSSSRKPRNSSKKKNQAKDLSPTQVYVQPIPSNVNINHRKSYYDSLVFSDLGDFVEEATMRDSKIE